MAETFNIEIRGLDKILKAYNQAPSLIEPILQQGISKSAAVLAAHTDADTVPYISGNLVRSFNPVDIGRLFARWYPRAEYASAVQHGMPSGPGRFVPGLGDDRKGRRLVNTERRSKSGKVYTVDIGTWPGFKGRHYMENIVRASKSDMNELWSNVLKAITKTIANA